MWIKVRNPQKTTVILRSADGDSISLQPLSTTKIDDKFLWQVPDEVKITDQHPDARA